MKQEKLFKEQLKMLQIRENAHTKIKKLALERNMSMKDYIEYLIELDEEMIKEEKQ